MIKRMNMEGHQVVVTGAAAGIGAATARAFAEMGATVVAVDRDREGVNAVVAELVSISTEAALQHTPQHLALHADLTSAADLDRIAQAIAATGRPVKTLVNNVGVNDRTPMGSLTRERWQGAMALNLTSNVFLTQALIEPLLACESGGSIVNVSSAHGLIGMANAASYATAKAGLLGLTRQLAAEYAAAGLRVNAVCPGLTLTERIKGRDTLPEDQRARLLGGRFAEADEVAATIAFLGSDAASYLTGVVIPVDGGYSAR